MQHPGYFIGNIQVTDPSCSPVQSRVASNFFSPAYFVYIDGFVHFWLLICPFGIMCPPICVCQCLSSKAGCAFISALDSSHAVILAIIDWLKDLWAYDENVDSVLWILSREILGDPQRFWSSVLAISINIAWLDCEMIIHNYCFWISPLWPLNNNMCWLH